MRTAGNCVTVAADADGPSLTVADASGAEDSAIALSITSALTDTDGSETLSVTIAGVPSGASLSAGTDNSDGTWTLTPAQLAGLTITPPSDSDADFSLTVTATSTTGTFNVTVAATSTGRINVTVAADADAPSLTVADASGSEDTAIALSITAALTDTDGSETLSVTIAGVPGGASLSAGTDNLDGTWTLTPAQLAGLTITPPSDSDADFSLTVTATSTETDGGDTATTSGTINVTVAADNRKPKRRSFVPSVVRLQRRLENLTRDLLGQHSRGNGSSAGNGSDIGDRTDASADTRNASKLQSGESQMRFLAYSVRLEESGTPLLARCAIIGVVCLITALIIWSAFTSISEVAAGPGQVLPSGKVKVVQHLEGGIVAEILVREGALVNAGDVLVRLEKAGPLAELEQVRVHEEALRLVAERLQAFANGKSLAPLSSSVPAKYRQLVKDQLAILEQQGRTTISRRKLLLSQIKQRAAETDILEKREARLKKETATVGESFEMKKRLFRKRVISRTDYLKSKRDFERVSGELVEVRAIQKKAREALIEAKVRMTELESRRRENALTERGKVTAELAQVREKLERLQDRFRRLEIRAPIRGYVKGLKLNTVGGVVLAGAPIMEIVPVDQELFIESRITTHDIGHVRVGQRVRIKFDTYNYARYGIIYGRLRAISATTFQEKGNPPYYRGTVSLDRRFVGPNPRANPILAGMTVQAEIVTGSKSLLTYLLKPIRSVTDGAFRER